MTTTNSYGSLAHTDGWFTTSPEALRKEAQRLREARELCRQTIIRRRGEQSVRISPPASS
jgi:hypothetical protein